MLEVIVGAIAAVAVMAWWVLCRKRSLPHLERAAELIEAFYASEAVDREKEGIYWTFKASQQWLFMPLMTLCTPFIIFWMLTSKPETLEAAATSDDYRTIMEELVKLYITRNPVTGAICMTLTMLLIGISASLGLMLNRLKTMPTLIGLYGSATVKATQTSIIHSH